MELTWTLLATASDASSESLFVPDVAGAANIAIRHGTGLSDDARKSLMAAAFHASTPAAPRLMLVQPATGGPEEKSLASRACAYANSFILQAWSITRRTDADSLEPYSGMLSDTAASFGNRIC